MIQGSADNSKVLIGDFESDPGSHTHEVTPIFKVGDSPYRLLQPYVN